jgi:predicted hydrocarbon binding protein
MWWRIGIMSKRAERWLNQLESGLSAEVAAQVMEGCEQLSTTTSALKRAALMQQLMDNLEAMVDESTRTQALENCGRWCIAKSTIDKARRVWKSSKNLDEFLFTLNEQHIGGGKLVVEGDTIHATYERCYCGMVNQTKAPMSATYCNCSRGWFLALFEAVFAKPVQVKLVQSIVQGASSCEFIIRV